MVSPAGLARLGLENHCFNACHAKTTEHFRVCNYVLPIDFGYVMQAEYMKVV